MRCLAVATVAFTLLLGGCSAEGSGSSTLSPSPATDVCKELLVEADEALTAGDHDRAADILLDLTLKGCATLPLGPSANPS
jgi:hypothetical protein